MFLWSYHITTGAGHGVQSMMNALYDKKVFSYQNNSEQFQTNLKPKKSDPQQIDNYENRFLENWSIQLNEIFKNDSELDSHFLDSTSRWGILLATTKGAIEDSIWEISKKTSLNPIISSLKDPGEFLLSKFLNSYLTPKNFNLSGHISQACSSSHIAFEIAQLWLSWNKVDFVLILSGDLIGPFVFKGFSSLKLLTSQNQMPFDANRDGLLLGDAVGCAVVSLKKPNRKKHLFLKSFKNYNEGAVTKPSLSGDSLFHALLNLKNDHKKPKPDFVVAHGTGTRFNDLAEDRALFRYFKTQELKEVPVTGAKWCLGHSLGASGLVDIIAASEVLINQKLFSLANTVKIDPQFEYGNYLIEKKPTPSSITTPELRASEVFLNNTHRSPFKEALITSLGFGGVHAACWMELLT